MASTTPVQSSHDAGRSLYIGGRWTTAAETISVFDPARGEVFGSVAAASAADTAAAVEAAAEERDTWEAASGAERAVVLENVARILRERCSAVAEVLSRESGKLRPEAEGEVLFAADYFAWFAGEARRLEPVRRFAGGPNRTQLVRSRPLGVAALLTPWNFPVSIQARKLAAALAAGCTVVARPSSEAPLSVVALFECLEQAGLPAGVANLVTGSAEDLTNVLLADARVRAISFTGSTGVGKSLYAESARTVKHVLMELGGAAPFVVCDDADLEHTLEHAMLAKFRNCGQSCIAANTFFVERSLYEPFVDGLAQRIEALSLGDPLSETTTLGPVINERRRAELDRFVDGALASGLAHVTSGPSLSSTQTELAQGSFCPPRLLAATSWEAVPSSLLYEEVFGPVAVVLGYDDLDRLLETLKQSPYGLAGYVFSRDSARALQIAAELEVGMVGVNEGLASAVNIPMGGVKDSGLGREGGHTGMAEFMDSQSISLRTGLQLDRGRSWPW